MLPLALSKVDKCKLCLSVHIPPNVAKLIGADSQLQMHYEVDCAKNVLLLPVCFLQLFSFSFFFFCVCDRQTLFSCYTQNGEQNMKCKQAAPKETQVFIFWG